jgi:hypothetical protein
VVLICVRVGWSGVSRWWRRRSPRLFARSRAPAPRWRSGSTAGGWSTCGAGRPIRQLAALGAVTASCSRTRSPSHSSPCARCCWSSAASWSWTLWCSATGRSSPPAQRCGSCSPTRRAWWLWMPPRRRSCSMTGKQCAAGRRPAAGLGTGDRTRGVGTVLRASRRRARAPHRRSQRRRVPPRRGLRAARAGLRDRAGPDRPGPCGRYHRTRRGLPRTWSGRARALPASDR